MYQPASRGQSGTVSQLYATGDLSLTVPTFEHIQRVNATEHLQIQWGWLGRSAGCGGDSTLLGTPAVIWNSVSFKEHAIRMCVRAAVSHSVIIENACRSLYNVIDVFACGSDILKVIAHKFNDIFAWTNTCT